MALKIAEKSPIALGAAKKAVLAALDSGLTYGLQKERQLFYQLFDTADQKEGMKAFMEKRKPEFRGE